MYYEAFFNETGPGVGPIPWTHTRGPAYWDGRLREHWSARGVNVTENYLKVRLLGRVPRPQVGTVSMAQPVRRIDTTRRRCVPCCCCCSPC